MRRLTNHADPEDFIQIMEYLQYFTGEAGRAFEDPNGSVKLRLPWDPAERMA